MRSLREPPPLAPLRDVDDHPMGSFGAFRGTNESTEMDIGSPEVGGEDRVFL